jgi:hypothetical protein
MRPERSGADEL